MLMNDVMNEHNVSIINTTWKHNQSSLRALEHSIMGQFLRIVKGFLQLNLEAAMLPGPRVETRPPPPVPPFLLAQNLIPKDIAGSDITS